MRRWIGPLLLAGLLAPSAATAQEAGAWVVDGSSGCRVWNPEPQPGETVLWDGPCHDGIASGEGWLQWFRDGRPVGQFVGAMRDGREGDAGTWVWDDGSRFEGTLKDGSRDGPGSAIEPDGSRFEGSWRDSRYDGSGRLLMASGDLYEGEFRDDAYAGIGVLRSADGGRYEGQFADGVFEGGGVLLFADGTRYAGTFRAGRPDGRGTLTFRGGARYEGGFRDGRFDGQGTLTDPGGTVAGTWRLGCLSNGNSVRAIGTTEAACGIQARPPSDGTHAFVTPDGTRSHGTFRNGRLDGPGVVVGLNGSRWVGRFAAGALVEGVAEVASDDGVRLEAEYSDGIVVRARKAWPDGRTYEGGLRDGRESGFGRERGADGAVYEGEFADGRPHGPGVRRLPDGTLQAGDWKNGCLVTPTEVVAIRAPLASCGEAELHDGHGTIVFANGSRYEGAVEDGTPQGQGKWTTSDGGTAEGFFRGASLEGLGVVKDAAQGTRYVGELRGNRPNGRGTLTTALGLSFSGPWRDGCLQGHGLDVWFLTSPESCGLR